MTSPSKRKGNGFERELVEAAKQSGLAAKRAYASNGEALGKVKEVDLIISNGTKDFCVQAKRRKKLADFLKIDDGVDAVVFREDRGTTYVLVRFDTWLESLQ